jgi:hypothetical protein
MIRNLYAQHILDSLDYWREGNETVHMSLNSGPPQRSIVDLWREAHGFHREADEDELVEDAVLPDPAQRLEPLEQPREVDLPPWAPMSAREPAERGLERFRELVAKLTYKPGYRLHAERDMIRGAEAGCLFRITFRTRNTYQPSEQIDLMQCFLIPHWLLERWGILLAKDEDAALRKMMRWVRKALGWHELHERDEWIRVDGTMVFNPHADGNPSSFRLDA